MNITQTDIEDLTLIVERHYRNIETNLDGECDRRLINVVVELGKPYMEDEDEHCNNICRLGY